MGVLHLRSDALAFTLGEEGGYVNDPRDPGGETNFGISKRAYPAEDIASLTKERAQSLMVRDYWNPCRCAHLPQKLATAVFDFAVNSGVSRAVKELQKVLGVGVDGIVGPATIAASWLTTDADLETYLWRRVGFVIKNGPSYARVGLVGRVMNLRNFVHAL